MTIVTGSLAFAAGGGGGTALNLLSTAFYVGATVLVYQLLLAVNPRLSLIAACSSYVGCALSVVGAVRDTPAPVNPLAFFGGHCLLVGLLILRSTFLPRFVGVLMTIAGIGWLTFALPQLGRALAPFNMLPGIVGEASLSLWLLIKGVDAAKWEAQAGRSS